MEEFEFELESLPAEAQTRAVTPPAQPETGGFGRTVARGAARTLEAVAGLPGDILSAGLGIGSYLTGGTIPTYERVQEKLGAIPTLPTSSQLRQTVTRGFTGEALEPRTQQEENFDTLVSDIATLSIPIKGRIPFKSALTKAFSGNAAAWLTKELGGSETAQAGAKFGVMTVAGLKGGRKALTNQMNQSYKTAEDLSKGATVSAKTLSEDTKNLLDSVSKGHLTPAKELVKGPLKSIQKSIKSGKISVPDAWELKRNINELIYDPATPRASRSLLRQALNPVNRVIKEYGAKNPEFAKNFERAEDIFIGLNRRSAINNFLQRHVSIEGVLKNPISKLLVLGASGGAYHAGLPGIGAAAAGIGTAMGAREGVQALEFLAHSSTARKYYGDLLKASALQDVSAAKRSAKNLDKVAADYSKKASPPPTEGEFEYELVSL